MTITMLPKMRDYEACRRAVHLTIPESYNFGFDVVDRWADESPDKVAIIAVDRTGEHVDHHSFDALRRATNRVARALRSHGVAAGDLALVIAPRIVAWHHALIGCTKAGIVAMPGTNLLTAHDIAYRIQRSEATTVIVTPDHVPKVEAIRAQCPSLAHLIVIGEPTGDFTSFETICEAQSDEPPEVPASRADDLMLLYFTSGTTGPPKMVPLEQSYALAHTLTGRYWMDLRPDDVHWTLSDTGWAKAAWGMMYPQMQMGAAIVLYDGAPRFDAEAHLRVIEKLKVTTFCAPPTVFRLFAQMDLGGYDLSSLRHAMGAGEPLNPEAIRAWKAATGTTVHDGYGQTETVNLVANYPCVPIRPGSMGKPVPGFDVDVVDNDGDRCGDDEVGHIALRVTDPRPPGLFRGYFQDDEATAKVFRDGWYYTGDKATRDADGYIWFVGRADDIITSSGYRISPFEVESALQQHGAVVESAAVGKKDELRGEIVKAYVVLAGGHQPSAELAEELQRFVREQTAPYKYPREVEFCDVLPKTISGKIRRVELRAKANDSVA